MIHYKLGNEVFAFEEGGSQDHLITPAMIGMSDADVVAYLAPTQAKLDEQANGVELSLLAKLDMNSIRDIREWITKQPSASQALKDKEAQAIAARGRLV